MSENKGWQLGRKIAPPRFLMFCVVFAIGLIVAIPGLGWNRGTLVAFDIASALFLGSLFRIIQHGDPDKMRRAAVANDANRAMLLAVGAVSMLAVLVAVAGELHGKDDTLKLILVVASLVLVWFFVNMLYALHYAHLYYSDCDDDGNVNGGLGFPNCDEPDYWDFIYFSFTLGMTFQTSDVNITSRHIRWVSLGQCLAAFIFNLGVIAFTINILGSGGG